MFELHVITDSEIAGGLSHAEIAKLAYIGGADVVQLRMKHASYDEMMEQARIIKTYSEEYQKFFIVNDNVQVALDSEADGVHVGQDDMELLEARKILGDDAIIGVSVTTVEEALLAQENGADYLGVGSVFVTTSKDNAIQAVGLDAIYKISQAVDIPVVGIGGINMGNIKDVIHAGAESTAIISAIVGAEDITKATHDMRDLILKARMGL